MKLNVIHPTGPVDPRASTMLQAIGGFPRSDLPLFLQGYSELCREDLSGKTALEICGGFGKLAGLLAETFPTAEVIGLDLYAANGPEIEERLRRCPKLSYVAGDAFDLSRFAENSVDLVFGQAALHHLAHDPEKLSREVLRILKPGGRLVFIFEPLGHNQVVAAIRATRMAKYELGDESNLFFWQFERMLKVGFGSATVQVFNLLGYPTKALSDRLSWLASGIQSLDRCLFEKFPSLRRYAANCNLVLRK